MRFIVPAFPAFNIYSYSARRTTALGPICVATTVNKMEEWDAEVIDENNLRLYGPKSREGGADHEFLQSLRYADAVGLYGGLTSTIPRLFKLARFYKDKGVITIAGGQHFIEDNIEEGLSAGIDYIVRGEGEETIRELLEALAGKRDLDGVRGIAFKRDDNTIKTQPRELIHDFDKLPLPDFSLVRYAKIRNYSVERIRGCGMECEFCTVKGKPRSSSPERLIERISFLLETRDARTFFIVDDLFGQHRDETIRFCHMIRDHQKKIGRRLDLGVQIRLDKAKDSELLLAMRQTGINFVAIGFESPIEEELKAMNKRLKPSDMLELTKEFRRFGFLVHGMFIFGYPMKEGIKFSMSAKERVKHYRRFIRKARLDTVQVMLPVPLPGTELRSRLERQNRVFPRADIGWEYYDGNFPLFVPDEPLTALELQESVAKIMSKVYQFRYMFLVGLNIFSFPSMVFFLHNIKAGWRIWYRRWRNYIIRFGGWMTFKKWMSAFKKDDFLQKLRKAQTHLNS
ncbi:MAG: radical SAM protein [Candidatus Omnitrophota bacterium]